MADVRLFYGSTTGNTQEVAQLIQTIMGEELASVTDIANASAEDLEGADALVLGVSTWDDGNLQNDWATFWPQMDEIDFRGKRVALFGLGDAEAFSGLFVNALRLLYDKVVDQGAEVVGACPTEGYVFESSAAVENGQFVGLVIDQNNAADQTVARVGEWVAQVRPLLLGLEKDDDQPLLGL